MLIPSIDIMNGRAVQLVRGERLELDCGDPLELASRLSVLGELAVVDLDAARGTGSNLELVAAIASRYPSRVGGGVRDESTMRRLLDSGARAVMVGTMATPGFLSAFPAERLMAALDNDGGEVLVQGWRARSGQKVLERAAVIAPYVGGFLVTDVAVEGSLGGADVRGAADLVSALRSLGFPGSVTVAGGITSAAEIAALDAAGADAQVGMALYKGLLDPAEALAACLRSDRPDGLWPTVVCDEDGVALGLAYSDAESLKAALAERRGVYRSRARGLWRKGESSGATQELLRVDADCDRDALRFTVRQAGPGFCHRGSRTCFGPSGPAGFGGEARGFRLLSETAARRLAELTSGEAPAGSYTARLYSEPGLLAAKLAEEAAELAEASGPERAASEAADLIYFAAVKLAREGASLEDAARVLDLRALKVTRRPGNAKARYVAEGGPSWANGIH